MKRRLVRVCNYFFSLKTFIFIYNRTYFSSCFMNAYIFFLVVVALIFLFFVVRMYFYNKKNLFLEIV